MQRLLAVLTPRSFFLATMLAVAGSASAQNYRLSAEPTDTWGTAIGAFAVGGQRVVFDTLDPGSSNKLWSAPADRSTAPILLHDGAIEEFGDFELTRDGEWAVYVTRLRYHWQHQPRAEDGDGNTTRGPHLIAQRTDGSGAHFLNGPLVPDGDVIDFTLSPDSRRVVYRADQDKNEVYQLYSRALDGTRPPVNLSGTLVAGRDVTSDYRISPDGAWVVYRADQDADEVYELYGVPIDGSRPAVRLDTKRPLADVQSDFRISSDSLGVIYRADTDTDEVFELYIARIDGSVPPQKRSGALVSGGDVQSFDIAPGNGRIVYIADQDADEVNELYSVPTFSGAATKLSGTMTSGGDVLAFRFNPDGTRVVFSADKDTDGTSELYVVPCAGGPAPVKLHPDLGSTQDVGLFEVAPDGARVAFTLNLDTPGHPLYSAPIDASSAPVRLSGAAETSLQGVDSFLFVPDTAQVIYSSDEHTAGVKEFYVAPLDGSLAPRRLNGAIASGDESPLAVHSGFRLTGDGARLIYVAKQSIDAAQLWSVPIAGGHSVCLNEPFHRGNPGRVADVVLARDGQSAYYTSVSSSGIYDLWRVALDDPRRVVRMNAPLLQGQSISSVTVSPDGEWVMYTRSSQSSTSGLVSDLFSVPSDCSREAARVNGVHTGGTEGLITPDSSRVVYLGLDGLRSAPIDGSDASLHLDSGDLAFARVSSDSARVVYLKVQARRRNELWSVPTLRTEPPTRLDGPTVAFGSVLASSMTLGKPFEITPDGQRVVYVADQDTNGIAELYCVPIDGSSPAVKINGPLVAGSGIDVDVYFGPPFEITPDGSQVVYYADQDTPGVFELYRAPTLGGGPSAKVSGPLVTGGNVGGSGSMIFASVYQISPDGARVVYRADAEFDDHFELYSAPLDGSTAPVKVSALNGQVFDFDITPSSDRVAFRVHTNTGDEELFAAPIDASAPAFRLAIGLSTYAYIGQHAFLFTPDGQEVLFSAWDHNGNELFRRPLDGSRPAQLVNGPLVPSGHSGRIAGYGITPDGSCVVYIADQDTLNVYELFATCSQRHPRRANDPVPTLDVAR